MNLLKSKLSIDKTKVASIVKLILQRGLLLPNSSQKNIKSTSKFLTSFYLAKRETILSYISIPNQKVINL